MTISEDPIAWNYDADAGQHALDAASVDIRYPQPGYARLARECRFVRHEDTILVTTRADVENINRRPAEFGNIEAYFVGTERPMIPHQIDPPEHLFYRKILEPLFSRPVIAKLEPEMVDVANELIDGFIERGESNLVQEFTWPFPARAFCSYFGMPYEDLDWWFGIVETINRPPGEENMTDEEKRAYKAAQGQQIYSYFDRLFDARLDQPTGDVISQLLTWEADGRRLSREEMYDICFNMALASLHTTTLTMNAIFVYLAEHPDQRGRLVENPELIPSGVEELLRWESPAPYSYRRALVDTEVAGCPVRRGERAAWLVSANFDESVFPDPLTVDLERNPNRHLAFGFGAHRCLGIHFARLDLRVGLREFLRRIPEFALKEGSEMSWHGGMVRGPANVEITFGASA